MKKITKDLLDSVKKCYIFIEENVLFIIDLTINQDNMQWGAQGGRKNIMIKKLHYVNSTAVLLSFYCWFSLIQYIFDNWDAQGTEKCVLLSGGGVQRSFRTKGPEKSVKLSSCRNYPVYYLSEVFVWKRVSKSKGPGKSVLDSGRVTYPVRCLPIL